MLALLGLACLLALQPATTAQAQKAALDSAWTPIIEHEGVAFSYIYYPYADNEHGGVVLKLVNTNDYPVAYEFTIIFRAEEEERTARAEGWLRPGELKTGDVAGLFWIPFLDGRSIGEFGLRGYRVTPHRPQR